MKNISLNDWEQFSKRRNSIDYKSKDGKWMLKLSSSRNATSLSEFEEEKRLANLVSAMGLPTPEVKDIVQAGDTEDIGLIYQYIEGKKSVSRAIGEDPSLLEGYIKHFADMAQLLHKTDCNTSDFPSIKENVFRALEFNEVYNEEEKGLIKKFVEEVPDDNKCLHMDLNMSNVIVAKDQSYLIDLGSFCYGNPLFDLGNTFIFFMHHPTKDIEHFYHMPMERVEACWVEFLKDYFGVQTKEDRVRIEDMLLPYSLASFAHTSYVNHLEFHEVVLREKFFDKAFRRNHV